MTRVLVLVGVDVETRGLARHLGVEPRPASAPGTGLEGVIDIRCVGLRGSSLAALPDHWAPATVVVSAGTCGALAPELRAGVRVVPDVVIGADGARLVAHRVPGVPSAGALLDVTRVVATAEAKARLWLETGALAVDMESAPILRWAQARDLPGLVVRAVCDTARDGLPASLTAAVDPDGRLRTSRALRTLLADPAMLPRALALRRGTNAALTAVASTLALLARTPARGG